MITNTDKNTTLTWHVVRMPGAGIALKAKGYVYDYMVFNQHRQWLPVMRPLAVREEVWAVLDGPRPFRRRDAQNLAQDHDHAVRQGKKVPDQ